MAMQMTMNEDGGTEVYVCPLVGLGVSNRRPVCVPKIKIMLSSVVGILTVYTLWRRAVPLSTYAGQDHLRPSSSAETETLSTLDPNDSSAVQQDHQTISY